MRSHATDRSLESIAGAPLAILEGAPGGTTTFQANAISPTAPRTCYTVFTTAAQLANNSTSIGIAVYGTTGLNDTVSNTFLTLRINQGNGIDQRQIFLRRTGGAGVGTPYNSQTGRHIVTWGIDQNANMFFGADGGSISTDTGAVMSIAHNQGSHGVASHFTPIRTTLIYQGLHTPSQRKRIESWLLNRRYPPESLTVEFGPNANVGGVYDSTASTPAEVGPTGKVIGRMTRNADAQVSYGSYIKATRAGYSRLIPAGTVLTFRVWMRTNWTGTAQLQAVNDAGNYFITGFQSVPVTADTWQLFEYTFTCLLDFRASDTLRSGLASGAGTAGRYIDYSDPTIEVIQ